MTARRCAVLGSPIDHSLSPTLHRAAYATLGLDWRYDAYDVHAASLSEFVTALGEEWVGLSLTMPLKEAVLAVADDVDPLASRVGAANTLLLGARRQALNTDVPGLLAVLAALPAARVDGAAHLGADGPRLPTATVLGGGATARSALVALAGRVGDVVLLVRDPSRVGDLEPLRLPYPVHVTSLLDTAGLVAAMSRPLVVSTAPAGALDALAAEVRAFALGSGSGGTFVDVLYNPWPTPLAAAYAEAGRQVVGGLDLLVHQAALQVEAMTGQPAPLPAMWAAVGRT